MSVKNIYSKQIDTNIDVKYQRRKPQNNGSRALKDVKKVIEAPQPIVDDGAVDESDEKLLEVIKDFLFDLLKHSYNPLFEQLFDDIGKNQVAVEENDSFHIFKVQSFVLEAVRIKAKAEHSRALKEALEAAKSSTVGVRQTPQTDGDDAAARTGEPLKKQQLAHGDKSQKQKTVQVPFTVDVRLIGVSLQFHAFEFLYSSLYRRSIQKSNVKDESLKVSDKEFHAALQLFYQILHIVQLMASCSDASDEMAEKNRKNANILRSHIFRNDIIRICLFAFQMYMAPKHSVTFLSDVVSFTHTFLEHLEEFSKGRMLMIKTGRRRKVRRPQRNDRPTKKNLDDNSENEVGDGDFDPAKPDELSADDANGHIEDTFHDEEMDEESE